MESIQYNPTQSNTGFNPVAPVDYTDALATEHEKLLAAERQVLDDMRRDAKTIAANDAKRIEGIKALADFSSKAADELSQFYVDDAIRQRKDAFVKELLDPTAPSPDYVEGRKEAESQYIDGQKVATEIGKVDYEAAEPFRSGSVWAQMGRKEAQALMGIENELPRIIEEATKQFTALPPAEREDLINDIVADYAERKGLTGLRRSFLEDKILPTIRSVKSADARQYKLSWTQRDGARREEEIRRGLGTSNPAMIIPSLAALPDQNGYPIGNAGAWDKFVEMISEARINGTLSNEAYESMRNTVIPEGNPGAGQTYGDYYRGRFFKIDQAIASGEIAVFKNKDGQEKIEARELEEQMVQSLLNDEGGFTSDTLKDMEAKYTFLTQGKTSPRLEALRSRAVDVVADEGATERLKELKRDGLLSVRLLKSMGVSGDVYDEFYDDAVKMDKARAAASSPDFIEDLVKTGGVGDRGSIAAGVDGSRNYTVGLATDSLSRFYNRTLSSILEANPEKSVEQAQQEAAKATVEEYTTNNKYRVEADGYPGFSLLNSDADTSGVAAARQRRDQIEENAQRVPGYLDKGVDDIGGQAAFSKGELESITNTYGSIDFVMPEKAKALARIKGIDPFQVINRQLRANGMEPLPDSPAVQVFQDSITPEQQRIFNMNPTPASSIRTMGSVGEFKPELVPKGYGSLIEQAAKQYDIPPSIIAGLIETESNWNPQAVSPVGAKGLTQFMPETAAEWGVNPFDPASAIDGAGKYLRYLVDYFGGDLEKAIYAYNGGMGNVERLGVGFDGPGGENYRYYPKVMRAAYKYGYKEALDVALVRPAFQ